MSGSERYCATCLHDEVEHDDDLPNGARACWWQRERYAPVCACERFVLAPSSPSGERGTDA